MNAPATQRRPSDAGLRADPFRSRMLYLERDEGWYALFSQDGFYHTMPLYRGTFREISEDAVCEMIEPWVVDDDGTPILLSRIGNFEYFTQTPRGRVS